MPRRVLATAMILLSLFPLAGCTNIWVELLQGGQNRQARSSETYYCGHFGLKVTIPQNWFVNELHAENLTEQPEDSARREQLTPNHTDRDYYFYEMLVIGNRRSADDVHHTLFDLSVYHDPDFISVGVLADYWLGVVEEPKEGGGEHRFYDYEWVRRAGREMLRLIFEVDYEGAYYREDYYLCQIGEYDYFMAYVNYWPDDDQSLYDASTILERSVEFIEPPGGEHSVKRDENGHAKMGD